jgi:uncharacterized protein
MNTVLKIVIALAGMYLMLVLILYLFQGQMLFLPDRQIYRTPSDVNMNASDTWIETRDGKTLHGWYFPSEGARFVVVLSHGNAGNISGRLEIAELLNELGVAVLLYDYRGYGQSDGRPSERGLYKDITAVISYLEVELGYPEDRVILYGRSLGGAVSAWAAKEHDVAGLVLDSSFTDLRSMAREIYPIVPGFLVRFNLSTLSYLQKASGTPVMIMHSREDEIVRYHHGEQLYEAAGEPKTFVPLRGGHNDLFFTSMSTIRNSWATFLESLENNEV